MIYSNGLFELIVSIPFGTLPIIYKFVDSYLLRY